MSRRSRRSKRKLNSLFMMILLTGMLLLSSTYAWFSANKEVALEGINAKVVAAEGLQISLDGESWSSKITINKNALQDATANNYVWPDALVPVSTVGTLSGGNMNMYYGDVSADGSYLTNPTDETTDSTKYIVFDLYFKNSSSRTAGDTLQLNAGSKVAIASDGQANTGLENSVRSAVVLYSNAVPMTSSGTDVRGITAGTPKVSIWEPNNDKHIAEIVANDSRITGATQAWTTLGLNSITTTHDDADNLDKIAGVNGDTAAGNISEQKTIGTPATVATATDMSVLGSSTDFLTLQQNKIMKARIYIWLEGQDPDCIDTASTGKSIDFVIGFTKPAVDKP